MTVTIRIAKPAVAVLLAAAVGLTAAACDNDSKAAQPSSTPQSSTATTASPSTTPSTTPKVPPPTIPAAATSGLTVTAAEAFARFYLAAADHLSATGDSTLVRRWALPGCTACRALADSYEKTYRAGGGVSGSTRTQITRVVSAELATKDKAKVVFSAKVGPSVLRPSATASPTPLSGGNQRWELYLSSQGGHWMIYELRLTE